MYTTLIIAILFIMLCSAFFSGMEIAFVSSNRMLLEMDKERDAITSKPLEIFYKHPNNFVSTMLVGNNIALVLYGILFAKLFDTTLFAGFEPEMRVFLDTILSTVIVLFTGEFLPKTIFKNNPNYLLKFFAYPALFFYIVLWPISRFATMLSRICLRIAGVKIDNGQQDDAFTRVDLDHLVQSSIDHVENQDKLETEVELFQNVLDFSDTKVRDCMEPRTEVTAVDIDCTQEELMQKFIESGKSKIIVYHEDIDHIVGYIHSSEMFRAPSEWRKHLREMPFVPETMAAKKMMQMFLQQKKSIGIVVDEFGGTSGIVCLEDIVEEIFGEIEDEHDNSKYIAKQISENEYILSARLEIEKVNEMFQLDLPESDDYMTIGGLILHEYQNFPKLNEIVDIYPYSFKIVKSTMTKIELVRVKVEDRPKER
ncbi:MAG: HlyC/CorC family transporter [Prevotella sp.]|nr:HlyC/CorC family transporter [Prevotella sp.]